MSFELIAILVTVLLQTAILGVLASMVFRMSNKQAADDAALHLQGKRIEEITREMRESLRK